MPGARLLRILSRLEDGVTASATPARLCERCADVMAMTGAGIMLMSGDVPRGPVCSSNGVSTLIEDVQYTVAHDVVARQLRFS